MNYPQIKPTLNLDFSNTKTLDPRINFRRGTPGAYYDGKTHAKAEENLISYSEDFSDESWIKQNGISVESNIAIAPDGNVSATRIYKTGAQWLRYEYTQAGTYTLSCWVKSEAESGDFTLESWNANDNSATGSNSFTATNEWRRYQYTVTIETSNGTTSWYPCVPENPNERFFIWGAQLEQRESVTAYTPTNGNPITKYQPQLMFASPDQPRFDHDVLTGESKGLLIEESRTNLISYSEDFTASFWNENRSGTITNDHILPNQTISPDGVSLASKIVPTNNNGVHYIATSNLENISQNTVYSASFYVKAAEIDTIAIAFKKYDGSVNWVNFDLTNITATPVHTFDDYSIQDVGNGWRKCVVSLNLGTGSGSNPGLLYMYVKEASAWTGNNYDGVYVWGAQVEAGSFPTSYIKTSGASATRSADNASITGENFSSWYRQDEGSLYSEVNTLASSSHSRISMSDGTSSNRIFISNGIYPLYINKNGDIQVRESSGAIVNVYSKRAAGLKKNDFALSIDGGDPLLDTSGDLPLVDRLAFSTSHIFDNHVNGHIKKLSYYPQRLTNEQLQQLTK